MFQFPLEEQRQLIREGVELFRNFTGRLPRAYRAGCYGASEVTLAALREAGVYIDSSYNLSYLGQTCGFKHPSLNAPQLIDGVHEFPVTNFNSWKTGAYKPLEISAVSVPEILTTLGHLRKAGCKDAVLVFHSFSFLKGRGVRFENSRPDRIVIHRFRKLCAELAARRDDIEICVLGNVNLPEMTCPQPQLVPTLGWFRPAVRKVVQGLDYIPWV